MTYFISINGRTIGPMSAHQLFVYNPTPQTMVSTDGLNWQPLYAFPDLMQIYSQEYPRYNAMRDAEVDSKRILCGIMAMIFGTLGVQYFILGKIGGGFITILLSIITCGLWEVVTFIQGILMLCMSDSDFRRKYIDNPATLPLF